MKSLGPVDEVVDLLHEVVQEDGLAQTKAQIPTETKLGLIDLSSATLELLLM